MSPYKPVIAGLLFVIYLILLPNSHTTMKKRIPIRHGELLLLPVDDIDMSEAVRKTDYIASHSETGHHHVIQGDCMVLEQEGQDTFISLDKDSEVVHKKTSDKHDSLPVQEGIWRTFKKKEYDPFQKVMREVYD